MRFHPVQCCNSGLVAFSLASLILIGCGSESPNSSLLFESAYDQLHGNSGISGKPYADIVSDFRALSLDHEALTEIVEYGTSGRGKPLTLMRIQDKSVMRLQRRPAALISEGIHGDEYLNITDRLPAAFLEGTANDGFKQFLARGGVIFIVPILNPDGYSSGRRENSAGTDLNRSFPIKGANYPGRRAPETEAIRNFIANEVQTNNLSLEVSMEYHCCIGALIQPWAYKREAPAPDVQQRAQKVADSMRASLGRNLGNGTVHQILNYPPTSGGSDDYYLENYGRRAFSYEGRYGTEDDFLEGHVKWWDEIFKLALDTH